MNHNTYMKHYGLMGIFMIIAGFLSTMNVWANSMDDIRLSLNDIYMVGLMTSWMFVFMAVYDRNILYSLLSFLSAIFFLLCIRYQLFITERQFLLGMIPHHSMAIHMSKQLSKRQNTIPDLLDSIQSTQAEEIQFMKQKLAALT